MKNRKQYYSLRLIEDHLTLIKLLKNINYNYSVSCDR